MPFLKELTDLKNAFHACGIEWSWNEPMASHTTFRIGGAATLVAWPAGQNQIITVLNLWRELGRKCPLCVLGKGSNVLFPDRGFHGLVVMTTRAKRIVFAEDMAEDKEEYRTKNNYTCQVYAECGAPLIGLSYQCSTDERSLSGLEFACGIPGTVGNPVLFTMRTFVLNIIEMILGLIF